MTSQRSDSEDSEFDVDFRWRLKLVHITSGLLCLIGPNIFEAETFFIFKENCSNRHIGLGDDKVASGDFEFHSHGRHKAAYLIVPHKKGLPFFRFAEYVTRQPIFAICQS